MSIPAQISKLLDRAQHATVEVLTCNLLYIQLGSGPIFEGLYQLLSHEVGLSYRVDEVECKGSRCGFQLKEVKAQIPDFQGWRGWVLSQGSWNVYDDTGIFLGALYALHSGQKLCQGWFDGQECKDLPVILRLSSAYDQRCRASSAPAEGGSVRLFELVRLLNQCLTEHCGFNLQELRRLETQPCTYIQETFRLWKSLDPQLARLLLGHHRQELKDLLQKSPTLSMHLLQIEAAYADPAFDTAAVQQLLQQTVRLLPGGSTYVQNKRTLWQTLAGVLMALLITTVNTATQVQKVPEPDSEFYRQVPPSARVDKFSGSTNPTTCSNKNILLYDEYSQETFEANMEYRPYNEALATHTPLKSRVPGLMAFPSDKPLPQNVRVEIDGSFGERVRFVVTRFFNILPPFTQRMLQGRGLKIVLLNDADYPNQLGAAELFDAVVHIRKLTTLRLMVHTVVHELGHAISLNGWDEINMPKNILLNSIVNPQNHPDEVIQATQTMMNPLFQAFRENYSNHYTLIQRPNSELLFHPLFFDFLTQWPNPSFEVLYVARNILQARMERLAEHVLLTSSSPFQSTYAGVSVDELWAELTAAYIGVSTNTDTTGRIVDARWIHDYFGPYYELLQSVYGRANRWQRFLAQ